MARMPVGDQIRVARKEKGWTQTQLGEAVGLAQSTIAELEHGKLKSWPQHAAAFSRALGKPQSFFEGDGAKGGNGHDATVSDALTPQKLPETEALPQAVKRTVPLIGKVEAGAWAEIPDVPVVEDDIPVWLPEYERAQLFALRVSGRSMDQLYADGVVVIAGPAAEIGLRVGDIAVVRRHRGPFTETTLKEIVQEADGSFSLYPRSNDPSFQPIPLTYSADSDVGAEIIGVVVYSIDPTRRGRGPLVIIEPQA